MKPLAPVAIAGIGCICSAGLVLNECMEFLYKGKRNPAPPVNFPTKLTFPVFEVLENFFQSSLFEEKNVLRTCKLALTATLEAISDAGFDRKTLETKRVGACIGTNVGCSMHDESFANDGNTPFITPVNRFLFSNPTSSIASEFKITGPLQTVVNACSSGSDALGLAASWIRSGICDIVITGGAGLIGSAFSRACAECGANVVVVDIDEKRGNEVVEEIKRETKNNNTMFQCGDITNTDDILNLIDATVNTFGKVDSLVNNAYPRNKNYGKIISIDENQIVVEEQVLNTAGIWVGRDASIKVDR